MANAKIISFVDHEVSRVIEQTALEIEAARTLRVQAKHELVAAQCNIDRIAGRVFDLGNEITTLRLDLTNAIADNTLTLRNDINTLAAAVNKLRVDVDKLRQEFSAVLQSGIPVNALKQGGATPNRSA